MVELDGTSDIDTIKSEYIIAFQQYLLQAIKDGEIRYSKVTALLSSTKGVADYKDIRLNGGNVNVPLNSQQIPVIKTSNIDFVTGQVDG